MHPTDSPPSRYERFSSASLLVFSFSYGALQSGRLYLFGPQPSFSESSALYFRLAFNRPGCRPESLIGFYLSCFSSPCSCANRCSSHVNAAAIIKALYLGCASMLGDEAAVAISAFFFTCRRPPFSPRLYVSGAPFFFRLFSSMPLHLNSSAGKSASSI